MIKIFITFLSGTSLIYHISVRQPVQFITFLTPPGSFIFFPPDPGASFLFYLVHTPNVMKLFSLLAGALGLAHATEEVANAAGWQDASDADTKTWKSDVLKAESTVKQIKNKGCQVPKGKSLAKLGDPTDVRE